MPKEAYERKLREIEALRNDPEAALAELPKRLSDRNGYLVSKAAAVAGDLGLESLIPNLLKAFDRFFGPDPAKKDPKCWAKAAIIKALKDLGCREPEPYLRGVTHVQPEPVWGGEQDSAAALRGASALALVDCSIDNLTLMRRLVDLLADPETPARGDAALAIGQAGSEGGLLALRLKARLGDPEPEVIGQVFSSLLALDGAEAVTFLVPFRTGDDVYARTEAAAVLAGSHRPEALEVLRKAWRGRLDPETREALLAGLTASPLEASADFLLQIAEEEPEWREAAMTALQRSRHWRRVEGEAS